MVQKVMLIIYLIIGISVFTMCLKEDTDKNTIIHYKYINESGHFIQIKAYNNIDSLIKKYSIANNDSVIITMESKGASSPFVFGSSDKDITDSLVIIFDNIKYLYFIKDINDGPLNRINYENFENRNNTKDEYTFIYRISKEDYNLAKNFE